MKRLCEWQRQRKERRRFNAEAVKTLEVMMEAKRQYNRQLRDMLDVDVIHADIQAAIALGDYELANKLADRLAVPDAGGAD